MSGGGGFQKKIINLFLHKPVHMYMGGATFLYGLRWYETQTTFNFWFGKVEFERRVARHQL